MNVALTCIIATVMLFAQIPRDLSTACAKVVIPAMVHFVMVSEHFLLEFFPYQGSPWAISVQYI